MAAVEVWPSDRDTFTSRKFIGIEENSQVKFMGQKLLRSWRTSLILSLSNFDILRFIEYIFLKDNASVKTVF